MTAAPIPPQHAVTQNNGLGIVLRVSSMLCMASMGAMVKAAGERGVPLLEIIFFRNAFAFLPLGLYIWRTTGIEVLRTRRPLGHLTRASFGLCAMGCSFAAIQRLPLTEATALQFAAPVFMTALSAWMLREAVGRHRWAAVVVGFIGMLIMVRPTPGHMNGVGAALGLLGALGAAAVMVAIRQMAPTERGPTIVFYFTLSGAVFGLIGALFDWVSPDPQTLALLIGCGVVGGVGQLLLTQSLRIADIGAVAPFDYTQLVWAAAFGFLIWGQLPRLETIAGAVVVAASGGYILHRELKMARERASAAQEVAVG